MNATDDREQMIPLGRDAEFTGLIRCKRCNLSYTPSKSTSALRLTYCSFLCELGDLGFSMQGLEHMERVKKGGDRPAEPVSAGSE